MSVTRGPANLQRLITNIVKEASGNRDKGIRFFHKDSRKLGEKLPDDRREFVRLPAPESPSLRTCFVKINYVRADMRGNKNKLKVIAV